jgi:hypothetical protein
MEKKITASSTKNDIIEAYNELLKQKESQDSGQPKEQKEKEDRDIVIRSAATVNKEGIIQQIASLKISLNAELEKVEDALVTESKKLSQLQEAIKLQDQRLQDLYGINATADSVSAMLTLQKEKKEAFEKEMEQKRNQFEAEIEEIRTKWEKGKKEQDLVEKEEKDRLNKQHKREEEEYSYSIELTRKKDKDQYEQKKQLLDKELTDRKNTFEQEIRSREQAVIATETELMELREKTTAFPKELELAVKVAIEENTKKLETAFKFETQLKAKEYEGEIKLRDQEIANFKAKIKDIEVQLAQLAAKAEQADKSAKDIAIRAIESSSNFRIIERAKESGNEIVK